MKTPVLLAVALIAPALCLSPAYAQKKKGGQEGEHKSESKLGAYEPPFPSKMTWVLSSINGKPAAADATLMIDENLRGTGTGGCNTWSAALYPIRGKQLAMGPIAMTKKSCPAAIMAFERAYLTVLATRPTWDLAGSVLTVKSKAGALTFNRGL